MIYVGFEFEAIPNWDAIMPVKAPSNYKKPEAIAKYVAERKAELAGGAAAVHLLTGTVKKIAVIDGAAESASVRSFDGDRLDFLKTAIDLTCSGHAVVGCYVHKAMHLLATMNAIYGHTRDGGNSVPVDYFKWIDECYNKPGGFIDPISLVFGSSDTDLTSAAIRFGVSVNPDSAAALAEFAMIVTRSIDLGA